MKLSDFDYKLSKELIAQYPLKERDAARLLVVRRGENKIEHRIFKDIGSYLDEGDLLMLNDTKVRPCRLHGQRKTRGKVEVLLVSKKEGPKFNALIKPGRVKVGEKIYFNGNGLTAEVSAKDELTFDTQDLDSVYERGMMPLPPYIKRDPEAEDFDYYQTVYAKEDGSIASPTAGLHFTGELLNNISAAGVNIAYITLHISYSTFRPVKTEDITSHRMDKEYFTVNDDNIRLIKQARMMHKRIIAVGTTSCRALETYALGKNSGYTDLFIYPGYKFKMTDCLMTNFHLPKTTLLMLSCAFGGEELIKEAYAEAIAKKYRFYSYGDAMLII